MILKPFKNRLFAIRSRRGTTLIELMIAVAVMGVVSIGLVGSFGSINKAIQYSKARALASNLAQEQMQILKQKSFNRILVTTATVNHTGFTPNIPYDNGYYPPETIIEGSIRFTRLTYVEVASEIGNTLNYSGAGADSGMKAITVTVVWTQGTDLRKVQMRNILANIDTTMANATISGTITNFATTLPISGAIVTMAENAGYGDTTDTGGAYSIPLTPGSYTMHASAQGFFSQYFNVNIAAGSSDNQDFELVPMASGTIQGTAWVNDNQSGRRQHDGRQRLLSGVRGSV
jgi:prepilin-type N-terminal cleavage/methylation domain-containing protein